MSVPAVNLARKSSNEDATSSLSFRAAERVCFFGS